MPKVVICTTLINTQQGPHIEIFRKAGFEVGFTPDGMNVFPADNLIRVLQDADAVVAGSEPYTRHVIQSLPKLRVITRSGVGFDAIDLAVCDERDIPVCTTPVNHHSVAEHTIAMLMGLVRGFPELDRKVRQNCWNRVSRPRAMGRTLGILGLGRIGQAVAWRAIGLGIKVIACEPYPNQKFVKQWNIELVDLDTLLARSDFVSLHLPLSKENFQLMNRERFAKMKKGAILVNTARGPLIHEADLCEALKSGHLAGAGLDVFHTEPLPMTSPLLEFDNVLLAGHVAGLDDESCHDTSKMYAEIIVGLWQGRWPEGCVQNLKGRTGWKWSS